MLKQYRQIQRGEFFICAGDLSAGCNDQSVCQFLSASRLDVPLVYASNCNGVDMTNSLVSVFSQLSDVTGYKPLIAYERSNAGWSEMERLAALNRQQKWEIYHVREIGIDGGGETKKLGWDTNTATRPQMLASLKEAIDKRLIRLYDKATIDELYSFVVVRHNSFDKAQAERNCHDDLVMSLAIAWAIFQQIHDYNRFSLRPVSQRSQVQPFKYAYSY